VTVEARRLAYGVERYWLSLAWGVIDRGTPAERWFLEVCALGLNLALLGPERGEAGGGR
jgi:hypothetical protein